MGNQRQAQLETRNRAIYDAIQGGAQTASIASQYRLSERTIRSISQRMTDKYASSPADTQTVVRSSGALGEVGVSGLKESWGYIHEEFLRDLNTSQKRYKLYDEMRQNNPIIAAMMQAIELSIKQIEVHVDGEDERAEFVESCLEDMSQSWNEHVGEALTMLPFGFAPFEVVYKRRQGENAKEPSQYSDGRIGWRKFAFRSQDSLRNWDMAPENGELRGFYQQAWNDYKLRYIPVEKLLLYRTTSEKGNPEGRSILRPAYVPYYYVKNLQTVEAIGAERDLAGLPMIKLPELADTASGSTDMNNAEAIVRRIRQDEQAGAVIPFGWELTLLASPGSKAVDVAAIIERHEKRMAMVAMAQFLMLGMDKVGSYSLSKDHSDFFLMAINAIVDNVCETINKYAIPRLLKLNGMSTVEPPQLMHGIPSRTDIQVVGDFLQKMASSGFILPDDDFEKWLRDLIGAPALTQEMIDERQAEKDAQPTPPTPPTDGAPEEEKPGDGQQAGDGDDIPIGEMTLRQAAQRYAAATNTIRDRIKQIDDKRTRTAITRGSQALVDLNRDFMKRGIAAVKSITDEEWQTAIEADAHSEGA